MTDSNVAELKTDVPAAWPAVFGIALGVASLIVAEFLPAGTLTPIAAELNVSTGMAGQAVTATSIFAVIASLLTPYVTRAFDRRVVLLGLSSLLVLSNLSVAIAPNYWFLLGGRMILGLALGGFWAMAAATALRLVPEAHVPRALAIIFGGSSFASVFAAPASSFLGELLGWRNVFWTSTGLSLLALFYQALTLPAMKPTGEVRLGTLATVWRAPSFALGMLGVALAFVGHFAGFTYVRPFLETTTGLGANELSAVLMAFGIADFIATLFAGRVTPPLVRRVLVGLALAMATASLGLMTFGHSVVVTTVLVSVWGAVIGPTAVIWSGWVMRRAPAHAETAGGIYVATIQAAAGAGALFGGPIYDARGSAGIFLLCALAWSAAAAVTWRAVRD